MKTIPLLKQDQQKTKYQNVFTTYPLIQIIYSQQYKQTKNQYTSNDIQHTFIDAKPCIVNNNKNTLDNIDKIIIYIPGYMRLKFKNFISISLQNFKAQLNATLIFTIYYGAALDHLVNKYSLSQKDRQFILKKLQNQLILSFLQNDPIQLTEGQQILIKKNQYLRQQSQDLLKNRQLSRKFFTNQKYAQVNKDKQNNKLQQQRLIIKPNIDTTITINRQSKTINYTIRKNFKVRLISSVFLSPFQRINTILDISIQPLKFNLKFNSKTKLNSSLQLQFQFHINLLNNDVRKTDKILITETKKFGKYGLILPELQATYSNIKYQTHLIQNRRFKNQYQFNTSNNQRIISDIQKIFTDPKYISYRQLYKQQFQSYYSSYINNSHQMQLLQQEQQSKITFDNQKNKLRQFLLDQNQTQFKNFKYACFQIPLYKLPFTSLASIFLPLWLLGILNLGIFFQDQNLASRISSIASLMIAYIAFIPTIQKQVPPGPKIVLVEMLVYSLALTCILALIQSVTIRAINHFVLNEWWKDPYFIVSLIINVIGFITIMILMFIHYCIWQKMYMRVDQNNEKKILYKWRWYNKEYEQQMSKKYQFSQKIKYSEQNSSNCHCLFEIKKIQKKLNKYDKYHGIKQQIYFQDRINQYKLVKIQSMQRV